MPSKYNYVAAGTARVFDFCCSHIRLPSVTCRMHLLRLILHPVYSNSALRQATALQITGSPTLAGRNPLNP